MTLPIQLAATLYQSLSHRSVCLFVVAIVACSSLIDKEIELITGYTSIHLPFCIQ